MRERFLKPVVTKNNISDDHVVADEPLSPAARLFQSTELNCSIIIVLGSNTIIDVDAVKSGFMNSMVKHPRFSSLFVSKSIWFSYLFTLTYKSVFYHLLYMEYFSNFYCYWLIRVITGHALLPTTYAANNNLLIIVVHIKTSHVSSLVK